MTRVKNNSRSSNLRTNEQSVKICRNLTYDFTLQNAIKYSITKKS